MDAATPLIKSTAGIMEQTSPSYQNSTAITNGDDDRDKIVHEAKSCPWCKILTGVVLLSIIIFVIVDAFTNKYVTSAFRTFLEWVESNLVAGVFAFVGVYFVATVLFVPGSILTLGSGFVFGKAVGLGPGVALATAAVFVGASLGAIAA